MREKFDLIIFDCDGVLVDSEKIANEAFAQVLNRERGFTLNLDYMFEIFVGHSSSQCMDIIEKMLGEKPPKHLENLYKDAISESLRERVVAVNGVEQALDEIATPYCVASSGSYEKMHLTLGKTGLLHRFTEKLYSTGDVNRGKPSPDIYWYAAEKMGTTDPTQCLVIEDSPLGVRGGVAAGMTVFGYSKLTSAEKLIKAGAHHTFNDMPNLVREIASYTESLS